MNSDFDSYITRYSAELTRLCISLCGRKADAEDLFQETWHKAIKYYSKYDKSMQFDKWLFSICVNTYKNILKSAYNRKSYDFVTEEEKTEFINSIPDISEDNKQDYFELHEAVENLPKKQKLVLVMYYFKDYTVKEISEILKLPEGTVKSRLHSAKSTIKRRLENEE